MSLWDAIFGKKHKEEFKQLPTLSPEQQGLFSQLMGSFGGQEGGMQQLLDYYQQMMAGGPEATQAFEQPYMRQFQEQILPDIAERYGGAGALSSSGFKQELGSAGAGLQENLAQLREMLRGQAAGGLQQMMQNALQQQTVKGYYTPASRDYGMLPDLLKLGGTLGGAFLGGPLGASLANRFQSQGALRKGEMYSPKYGYQSAG